MSTKDENLIFVIDYENEKIREMNNFDLCDFLNDMQSDKANYKPKRYLFCPTRESAIHVLEGAE